MEAIKSGNLKIIVETNSDTGNIQYIVTDSSSDCRIDVFFDSLNEAIDLFNKWDSETAKAIDDGI